jgi:hypothetical protein
LQNPRPRGFVLSRQETRRGAEEVNVIALVAALALAGGLGTEGKACADHEAAAAPAKAAILSAYAKAEAEFVARLDEVGLVGSTLARKVVVPAERPAVAVRAARTGARSTRVAARRAPVAARTSTSPSSN